MLWIVGDVHGCIRTFERLLTEIRFDPASDELWCAGDLVNTGPHSPETLRLVRDLGARTILGNHDMYAMLAHTGAAPRRPDRLDALLTAPDADDLFAWLRTMPVLASFPGPGGRPIRLVHAGLHPEWGDPVATLSNAHSWTDADLRRPEIRFATRVRCCTEMGELARHVGPPEECQPPFRAWDDFYRGDATVVHGHWARRGHYRRGRVIGLDSGCVYGNLLTAWCPEADRIVQVPFSD